MPDSKPGLLCAVGAYVLWGVLPVYWKALDAVPAAQIVGHRILWSCVLLAGLIILRGERRAFAAAAGAHRRVALYALASALLSVNWFTYIWAVTTGRIVEASLGYYINPLVNVLLGLVVLRERLERLQWVAVVLAAVGVGYLTFRYGRPPWIALVLALTFAFYGLLKKTAPLGALHGLTLETALLLLPALAYLAYAESHNRAGLLQSGWPVSGLLAGTGVVTAVPLLLFARAARTIRLSTLGILQYLSPTCGLALGIWVYQEAFPAERLAGFCIIWAALLIYWLDSVLRRRT
jgi:chloramphenicol-sensitive protein RarD